MTNPLTLFEITRRSLPNGLQVWVKERPGTGTVSTLLVVRVGARVETPETAGISHFLEHLLFDGTARWDEQQIRRIIEEVGGSTNGWTSYEGTGFEVEVENAHLATAFDWLAEIAFRSTLPPDKVEKERKVIFQERGGRMGMALSLLLELFDRLGIVYDLRREIIRRILPGSRLEQDVIGRERTLNHIRRADLLAHYRRHYVPGNMALIVVGDVTVDEAMALAEKSFGGFAAQPVPQPPPAVGPAPGRFVNVRMAWPYWIDRALIRLGARTVGFRNRDRYALAVLAWMLSDRLWAELREERGLIYGVGAYNHEYTDSGYFAIETDFDGAQLPDVLRNIQQSLDDCKAGRFDDATLARAKQVLRGRAVLDLDSNYNLAMVFTEPALYLRPDEPLPDYFAEIDAVTRADVRRVANAYFRPENSYQAIFRPAFTIRHALAASGVAALAALPLLARRARRRP